MPKKRKITGVGRMARKARKSMSTFKAAMERVQSRAKGRKFPKKVKPEVKRPNKRKRYKIKNL